MTERSYDIDDPNLVWHYTSLSALIPILKNNSLLATEVNFQNDPHEERAATNLLQKLLLKVGEQDGLNDFPHAATSILRGMEALSPWDFNADRLLRNARFVLCASLNGDSLYAWRTYGSVGSVGCAIGLDRTRPLGVIGSISSDEVTPWRDVLYFTDDLDSDLLAAFTKFGEEWKDAERPLGQSNQTGILIDGLSKLWPEVRARAKHVSYRDEEEARVTVVAPHSTVVDFKDGRFGPRPHVRLGASNEWGTRSLGTDPLPIRSVRLGPDAPDAAFDSVKWLLAMNGYTVDGEFEHFEQEDEDGNVEYAERFDESRAISIRPSKHAYRDV